MLEKYKNGQPLIYEILANSIINNRVNHAYLFDTSAIDYEVDFALSFAKTLICPNNYFNNEKCNNCNICKRIDTNNYPEIKIIEPEGLVIKKEQLLELQSEFSTKPIEGNKKIYILKEADKLNKYAANSILKFLEEPEAGIIAILLTKNIYQVLDTIVSRCQVMTFKGDCPNIQNNINFITNFNDLEKEDNKSELKIRLNAVIDFVIELEKNKKELLLYTNSKWHNYFREKEDIYQALQIMILFYRNILNKIYGCKETSVFECEDDLKWVLKQNSVATIIEKISYIDKAKELLVYNINKNLLIDKLIIQLTEV